MIKPSVQPKSLRPIWVDFTHEKERCFACRAKLPSHKAIHVLSDGKAVPLGPVCANKYALHGTLKGIPDLTKGVRFERDFPEGTGNRKGAPSTGHGGRVQSRQANEEDRKISEAVRYVILRGDKLPQMGFSGLDWQPVTQLYESYLKGSLDPSALKSVTAAMHTNETNLLTRKFSLANLEACYAYGRLLEKIKNSGKWLKNGDFFVRVNLEKQLKSKLFLDDAQCAKVEALARRYLAKKPERVNVRFTAFRPEQLQNSLPFGP